MGRCNQSVVIPGQVRWLKPSFSKTNMEKKDTYTAAWVTSWIFNYYDAFLHRSQDISLGHCTWNSPLKRDHLSQYFIHPSCLHYPNFFTSHFPSTLKRSHLWSYHPYKYLPLFTVLFGGPFKSRIFFLQRCCPEKKWFWRPFASSQTH